MADVTPNDVVLITWRDPGAPTITLVPPGAPGLQGPIATTGTVNLNSPEIHAMAIVTLRGTPGEGVGFWRFGFIQLKFITDERAAYQGIERTHGSSFVAMDRPPARPQQLCRDSAGIIGPLARLPYLEPPIFYYPEQALSPFSGGMAGETTGFLSADATIPADGKMQLLFLFSDSPGRSFAIELVRTNNIAQSLNFIRSLYSGNAYATMFAVQKGVGKPIEVMKSFQWNVRWRAHFDTKPGHATVQFPPQSRDFADMNISHVVRGPPNDPLYERHILDTRLPNCLAVIDKAFKHPVIHESTQWEEWKVQH